MKRVRQLGGETRKVRWEGRRGAPDRRVMLPDGEPFWVETKRPGGDAEEHQLREHARMRRLGETVMVLDTKPKIDEYLGFTIEDDEKSLRQRQHVVYSDRP